MRYRAGAHHAGEDETKENEMIPSSSSPLLEKGTDESKSRLSSAFWQPVCKIVMAAIILLIGVVFFCWPSHTSATSYPITELGHHDDLDISRHWGQYSPYFSVPSEIPDSLPPSCKVTFAQGLLRHGSRYPTAGKSAEYRALVEQLHSNVRSYTGEYHFLASYKYDLGADDLTTFGQQEMIDAGTMFYHRYEALSKRRTPFFRAASEERVVESARNFTQGFHDAKISNQGHDSSKYPYDIMVISEGQGMNNTLNYGLCNAFEEGPASTIGHAAQTTWKNVFVPPIQARLNQDLAGADLTMSQVIDLMDLCPFITVASATGVMSQFCNLFSQEEWQQYNYYESLGKWYGYGKGNLLGSTQGVGFVNELIARMTHQPVVDKTSVNHTLDNNPATFPVGPDHNLFADFSHDNDMTGHFAAMGLYNVTADLSNTTLQNVQQTHGFSAAWTVPFAARAYFEKLKCAGEEEDMVRVLVNDRVIPLQTCGADALGRCTLSSWLRSMDFARHGGLWSQC